jgi:hypothetical protein
MKNKINIAIVLVLCMACNRTDDRTSPAVHVDSGSRFGLVAADTIVYDVVIRNPNPDDAWAAYCLSGINYAVLIDSLFDMVYSERIKAFNHETNEKLTTRQVHDLETSSGFSRDSIGMIQFTEVWFLDPDNNSMIKKVTSMVLGYNYYNSEGELFGHKPLFRVEMGKQGQHEQE